MGLIPIFFKAENEFGYIKAIIREEDKEFFAPCGKFYLSPVDFPKEDEPVFKPVPEPRNIPKEFKTDPDKGHGEVGSYVWHLTHIKAMEDKKEVVKYAKEVTDKRISAKGTLISVKVKALETIKEFLNHAD